MGPYVLFSHYLQQGVLYGESRHAARFVVLQVSAGVAFLSSPGEELRYSPLESVAHWVDEAKTLGYASSNRIAIKS